MSNLMLVITMIGALCVLLGAPLILFISISKATHNMKAQQKKYRD